MNREIKFRMWNPSGNNMLYDIDNVYECLKQQIAFDKSQPCRFCCTEYDHRSDGAVWQQFTGLHDKNGKEIYEGDLLAGTTRYVYEVRFESAKFVCYHAVGSYLGRWGDLSRIYDADMQRIFNDISVVGNIYQNPELLR